MKVLVGLGNPGKEYEHTLHNVGFQAIDALANYLNVVQWKSQFSSYIFRGLYKDSPYLLLKPQTFMNLSGKSVVACKQFFKLDLSDFLVISDDLDLNPGVVRYRTSGGHGGHNGLRNIIQLAGSQNFHRLKLGIGRPEGKKDPATYVLQKPKKENQCNIEEAIQNSIDYQLDFILGKPIQIQP